jgi:methyl-accepting chemotaxis protein
MKRSIIKKNFLLTMAFGLFMGMVFPLYASLFFDFGSRFKLIIFTAGCIIAGLLVGLISFYITKVTIIKIVKRVGGELKELNSGTIDLSRRIEIFSSDELGVLIGEFNDFIDMIESLLKDSQLSSNDSIIKGHELKRSMGDVLNVINDIGVSIDKVEHSVQGENEALSATRKGLKNLNDTVLVLISHILELFSNMDELTRELITQSESLDSVVSSVEEVYESITSSTKDSLTSKTENLVIRTKDTFNENLSAMEVLKKLIGNIKEISEKTSTLSINASIEAARSGKEGEGFKVIAQEVRKLSEITNSVSLEIESVILQSESSISSSYDIASGDMESYRFFVSNLKQVLNRLKSDILEIDSKGTEVHRSYSDINLLLSQIKDSLNDLKRDADTYRESISKFEIASNSIILEMEGAKKKSIGITEIAQGTSGKVEAIVNSVREVMDSLEKFGSRRIQDEEYGRDTSGEGDN